MRSAEPPTLSIANTSLTVAAGGSVSLGVTATPANSDDAVSVTISGVPTYETISAPSGDNVTHQAGSSTWTISSTAGVSITGLTLTSSYTGTGQPVAALSVTANNTTTGETASSASRTLNVTDPPALTSTSPPSSTTNTAPVVHLAALFDQFVAAGFHNDHHSSVSQIASLSSWQRGQEDLGVFGSSSSPKLRADFTQSVREGRDCVQRGSARAENAALLHRARKCVRKRLSLLASDDDFVRSPAQAGSRLSRQTQPQQAVAWSRALLAASARGSRRWHRTVPRGS